MYNNVEAQPAAPKPPASSQPNPFGNAFYGAGSGLIRGGLGAYGEKIFGSSSEYVQSNISRYFSDPQYYFQVNDQYVRNKLKVVLFPFLHRGHWTRITDPIGGRLSYKPPIYDINAPDLYIPFMAFGTYVVLAGFSLGLQGKALLPKWISGYYHKGVALWKQILLMLKYGEHTDSSWPNTSFPDHIEGPWRTILSHLNLIEERVSIKVGNGNRASFWHNHWINEAPISNLFPRLCTLAAYKQSTVNNFWDEQHGWTWTITYRRNFKEDEFEEWMALVFLMEFTPEALSWLFIKGLLGWFMQVMLLKVTLLSLGSGEAPLLDIVAYAGYAFTGLCLAAIGRISLKYSYYFLMPWMALCMGIFLVKTMKRVLFAEVRTYDSSRHHYLLLFIALAQFPLFTWLGNVSVNWLI
ncbi:hypothetical protein Csa_014630 [Cucumis sativus]|nr:hypothetical protein Csa_014630 [Cucumis sativus]